MSRPVKLLMASQQGTERERCSVPDGDVLKQRNLFQLMEICRSSRSHAGALEQGIFSDRYTSENAHCSVSS